MTVASRLTPEQEREFVDMVERADPDELAGLLSRPTRDEETVLVTYFGEDHYRRMHELALRRNLRRRGGGLKGNVVVLHGIMGSALTGTDRRGVNGLIWLQAAHLLGARNGIEGLRLDADALKEANENLTVGASGMLMRHYGELLLSLSEEWRVRAFWYDWRKDLRHSASALASRITGWFNPGEPVHLVAHSMGGLVARTFILQHPDLWNSMSQPDPASPSDPSRRRGGRLIMLGTPNHGSFAIPRVMAGNERLVKLLATVNLSLSKERLRDVLNTFLGSYQMLPSPLVDPSAAELYKAENYLRADDMENGVVVSQRHLNAALEHHERLAPVVDPDRMIYIAGGGERTYIEMKEPTRPLLDTSYLLGTNGDGRVPHKLGLLTTPSGGRVPTYYVPTSHGGLIRHRGVLDALTDLLSTGSTDQLATTWSTSRTPSAGLDELERHADRDVVLELEALVGQLGASPRARGSRPQPVPTTAGSPVRPRVTERERKIEDLVVQGWLTAPGASGVEGRTGTTTSTMMPTVHLALRNEDIGLAHTIALEEGDQAIDCVAVGHYLGVKPQAAELGLDIAISQPGQGGRALSTDSGLLTQLTLRGTITGDLGQPFLLPDPRDPARLLAVVGMGVPGRFGIGEMTVVARELAWTVGRLGCRHLATVLIGAGNGNLSAEQSVDAWLRGLAQTLSAPSELRLDRITFVEADPRRMAQINDALVASTTRMRLAKLLDASYEVPSEEIQEKWRTDALARDRAAARDRWTAKKDGTEAGATPGRDRTPARVIITTDGTTFRFGALTDAAAIPEREIPLDPALVREANDQLATEPDAVKARTYGAYLGRLLIPDDLEPQLQGAPLVLMLDSTTARVHWELVAPRPPVAPGVTESAGNHLGIAAGLTRQLRTVFAPPPEPPPPPERRIRVLVVADPAEDEPLEGAEEEGIWVADVFERRNTKAYPDRVEVVRLFGPREATRTAVLRHLMTSRFHVLHFAGHCFFDAANPAGSGWVFTNGAVLSARELRRIDRVPEFIFSNACESGVTVDRTGDRSADLAPSFAEAFFSRGVGNFVCTAWPVDDEAAREFAQTLYQHLLGDDDQLAPAPMWAAMTAARRRVADLKGGGAKSWGAYQHYGNPHFRLVAQR